MVRDCRQTGGLQMSDSRLLFAVAALATGLFLGCRDESRSAAWRFGPSVSATSANVRSLLTSEITEQVRGWDSSIVIDTADLRFSTRPSAAVEGMDYHWAELDRTEADYGYVFALVASRRGQATVVRNTVDWSRIARGWEPNDPPAAVRACAELYRIQSRIGLRGVVAPFGIDSVPGFAIHPDERARLTRELRDTATAELVTETRRVLSVHAWLVHPTEHSLAHEIACELPVPMGEYGDHANLAVVRRFSRVPSGTVPN